MWESLLEIDRELLKLLNNSFLNNIPEFWEFITHPERSIPIFLFFSFLLYKQYNKPVSYYLIVCLPVIAGITLFITNLVKNAVERLRPSNEPVLLDSILISQRPENFSFWSGHSAVSFAVTFFVYSLLFSPTKNHFLKLFFLWPILFALSRIMVGVHYPADVIVGAIAGSILGCLGYKLALYYTRKSKTITHRQ
ncbi:MAG: phosphatase PAP2 family protein [Bacteroidota bacterium]|nr:phosphatase PAP2 family protein [Bacteroidota bacterium]